MAENSAISWTHHTFNPWMGCTKVSEGCKFCYAERDMDHRYGKTKWGPKGLRVVTSDSYWKQPIRWNREAETAGERRRVFCASLADVFEGPETMPEEAWEGVEAARERLMRLIAETPHLDWLLLTKRPENVCDQLSDIASRNGPCYLSDWIHDWTQGGKPPANVWIGTSVENQAAADERIPHLLKIPAAVRFLSCEPLLENLRLPLVPVRLTRHVHSDFPLAGSAWMEAAQGSEHLAYTNPHGALSIATENGLLGIRPNEFERLAPVLHWVIAGGESGPNARPMHPDWARSLRDQCAAAGVPFHYKQHGEWCLVAEENGVTGYVMPESGRMFTWIGWDGKTQNPSALGLKDPVIAIARKGKHVGRLLDGVLHDAFPEVRA